MKKPYHYLRICAILLTAALLLTLAGSAVPRTVCSAEEEWIVGSGWTDYSANGNISFQNLSDRSGYMQYRELFDGQEGIRLSFQVDFPEPVFSVARVVLAAGSQPGKFFNILVYSENGRLSFDVGFCDNGEWSAPVVANTGVLDGVTDCLRVRIEHEAGSEYLRFLLTDTDDNVIFSKTASDAAYTGDRFLNAGDLRVEVSPYLGGNVFRFSRFTHDTFPDDGMEDPVSAEQEWSMAAGWTDSSADGKVAVTGGPAGSYIRSKRTVSGAEDFRISFVVEPRDRVDTSFVLTLGNPQLSAYLNIESTSNWSDTYQCHSTTQAVSLNRGAEYSWAWNSMGGLEWNWTPGAFRLTVEYHSAAHRLTLTREGVNGGPDTPSMTAEITVPAPADEPGSFSGTDFFGAGGGQCRIDLTAKNGALFTVSGFTAVNARSAAADWTMPAGWTDYTDFEQSRITGTPGAMNMRRESLTPLKGADIRYTLSTSGSAKVVTALSPQGTGTPSLQLLQKLQNGLISLELDLRGGETTRLLTAPQETCGNPVTVALTREAGSDTLLLQIENSAGSLLSSYEVCSPAFDTWALFDRAPLTVGMQVDEGTVTVSGFSAQSKPRAEAEQSLFKLGKGWTPYYDDNGAVYLLKTDGRENEAIYNPEIDGSRGFRISYDITFLADLLTTTYVKLGFFREESTRYFFARVKGDNGKLYAEGQVYDQTRDNWSGNILSQTAGEGREVGRTITVLLERQQGASCLRFAILDSAGGVIFSDLLQNEIIQPSLLNSRDLRFILGRDTDASAFRISNVSVEEYPVVPVALTDAGIAAPEEVFVERELRLEALVTPADATLKSIEWRIDGETVSEDSAVLDYTFEDAGTRTVCLRVTDFSGNTLEKELALSVRPQPAGLGDVNMDGIIDEKDAELIMLFSVGRTELTETQLAAADINADGVINSADAQKLLAGWEAADNEN